MWSSGVTLTVTMSERYELKTARQLIQKNNVSTAGLGGQQSESRLKEIAKDDSVATDGPDEAENIHPALTTRFPRRSRSSGCGYRNGEKFP
jgi:hypothetical protein